MAQPVRICDNCTHLVQFGEQGKDEFFNKCALLDIFNVEECEQCEYFKKYVYKPKPTVLVMVDPKTPYKM